MVQNFDKIVQRSVLIAIIAVFGIGLAINGFNVEAFMTSWGLYTSYALFILTVGSVVILPFISSLLSDPKALAKSMAGVVALAVIFLISYFSSDSEVAKNFSDPRGAIYITSGISQLIGAILYVTYTLMALTIIGIIALETSKYFK